MDLTHEFTVPAPVEQTWDALNDIASVAECFPGAQVTGVDGDTFTGTVKVKLGPIALVYNGTGTFVEKDEASRTMKIKAKGKDKRGNGTAGADVTATLTDADGGTRVQVVTDLAITGKPAQFGRGVIQDVSDKLLGQFTGCLETKVGSAGAAAAEEEPAGRGGASGSRSEPPPERAPLQAVTDAPSDPGSGADTRPPAAVGQPSGQPSGPGGHAAAPHVVKTTEQPGEDALDLGATVLPVLAKLYWKQALGAVVALAVVSRLLGRRR